MFLIPYVVINMEKIPTEPFQIQNLKKERDILLDWIKDSPPSNLTKELLIIRLSDAEDQLTAKTRELEQGLTGLFERMVEVPRIKHGSRQTRARFGARRKLGSPDLLTHAICYL